MLSKATGFCKIKFVPYVCFALCRSVAMPIMLLRFRAKNSLKTTSFYPYINFYRLHISKGKINKLFVFSQKTLEIMHGFRRHYSCSTFHFCINMHLHP